MAGRIDIGGYFDKLAKGAQGGRRLDAGGAPGSTGTTAGASSDGPLDPGHDSGSSSSGGGLKDALRDILGKGRKTAQRTTEKVKETARRTSPTSRAKRKLPPGGVVHVEYSPQRDGDPDPGEVVWTWVPFEEDPSQGKDRPVVVIGRRGSNLVGVPLTTKADDREAQVDMGTGAWDPKRRTSYARVWRMLDIDPEQTRREGSALDLDRFQQLVAVVDHYYDIRLPAAGSSRSSSRASTSSDTFDD